MRVREDKTIAGTMGGGLVEANVMDACMDMLDTSRIRTMEFSLNQEDKPAWTWSGQAHFVCGETGITRR